MHPQPLTDRILIQRIGDVDQIGSIYVPDCAKTRSYKGVILAVGPGKWHPGEWWYTGAQKRAGICHNACGVQLYCDHQHKHCNDEWQWIDGWLEPPDVHPGQTVYFSSQHNDFANADYEGNLPLERDEQIHLVRQADIIGVIPDA